MKGENRNRSATGPDGFGKQVSPATLGDHNSEAVFAAVKFEPSNNFQATYKFDWTGDNYSKSDSDGRSGSNFIMKYLKPNRIRT